MPAPLHARREVDRFAQPAADVRDNAPLVGDRMLAAKMHDDLQEAFLQDKTTIEAQARVLAGTDPKRRMAFIPQDKAPTMFRKLILERLSAEAAAAAGKLAPQNHDIKA